jgi:lycopene beta-cyclase
MSYLTFHLVFILPPLVVLLAAVPRAARVFGGRALWTLPAVAAIAFVYTTPWDNYLVSQGIWWYGPDRVMGTIGWVPIEEYMFFGLQPLLTGAWLYVVLLWLAPRMGEAPLRQAAEAPPAAAEVLLRTVVVLLPAGPRALGVTLYLLAAAGGVLALTFTAGTYLGLILAWAAPVLAAQWYFVGDRLAAAPRTFLAAFVPPTLYLWVADWYAIRDGIWSISPVHTTGLHVAGLPMEEALFFLVTNLLVVQGVFMFLAPDAVRLPGSRRAAVASSDAR